MEFSHTEKDTYSFVAKKKMPSGMTAQITFYGEHSDNQRIADFSIWLTVYKKRNQISGNVLKETGRDGLLNLIFAKQAIVEFENFILREWGHYHEKIFIWAGWDDNRRRRVYHRGLKDIGYDFSEFRGQKVLLKRIK